MIKPVRVRKTVFGEGIPKICVPIVDIKEEGILKAAKDLKLLEIDLIEWRVDFFEGIHDDEKVKNVLIQLREILGEIPILFTIRTSDEGGNISISEKEYINVNINAINSGYIDLVDVEMFMDSETSSIIIKEAHEALVKVVGSNHDFEETPDMEEILRRLRFMQEKDADIPKIAVMPKSGEDVLTLLKATSKMSEEYANRPIITMSMGSLGAVSRVCGQTFGSAVTFGSVNATSAPGQIEALKLRQVLNILEI